MRVLLLGNYSGLGVALKEGLQELGVAVTLATNGDGWKKIPGADEVLFPLDGKNALEKFLDYIIYPSFNKKFYGFDIVQAPGTNIFFWGAGSIPFDNIIKNNGKLFINAAGADYYLYNSWKNHKLKYGYYIYDDNPELCSESDGRSISSLVMNHRCKKIMRKASGIIPVVPYIYEVSYTTFPNLKPVIPLPVNTDKISYQDNNIKSKLVFFHGINRVKDKGSDLISHAMKQLQEDYPNDVECIIADRMPYSEYTECLKRANVIIDQCKGYGYGINACISMAMGKIVLSGAEEEIVKYFNDECPVLNIRPDVNHIYRQMLGVLERRREIPMLGNKSRLYIEKYHDYRLVTKKYMDVWLQQ